MVALFQYRRLAIYFVSTHGLATAPLRRRRAGALRSQLRGIAVREHQQVAANGQEQGKLGQPGGGGFNGNSYLFQAG